MNSLIATLLEADANARLFRRGDAWINAGDVCALAQSVTLPAGDGPIFLHVASAVHLCAGLLAAAAAGRTIALPAHAQASYVAEIGGAEALIEDAAFAGGAPVRTLENAALDPLLIFYTSGSTGTPKQVEKNLSRLEAEVRALENVWGGEAAHVTATVSHQHIYGLLYRIAWPIMSGRTADDTAAVYWEDLEGKLAGATLISSPAHLTRLPPRSDIFAPPPALIFSSGQLLPAPAARTCIDTFSKAVTEVLGSTETGGIAWRRQTTPDAPWTPLPSVRVSSDDENALVVQSPFLQTDAPQLTGDGVELAADGRFTLKPRTDRVAKIGGKRVSLTRVETAVQALRDVSEIAAFTLEGDGETLAAIVVLSAEGAAKLQELGAFRMTRRLRTALAETLEPAERPKRWRFADAIPTDSQGKRVLSGLRAMFATSPLDALTLDIREHTASEAVIAFTLPEDLLFFEGHFPERAVMPGLAQVHVAVLLGQKLWGAWPSDSNLARLKFRRVLLPGDTVVLTLKWNAAIGRLSFNYRYGEIDAAQGEIGGTKG